MENFLEVKEFDSITTKKEYEGKPGYGYLDKKNFEDLLRFIREYTADDKDSDALDFMRTTYRRDIGDGITIRNYVGLIQLPSGFQVQILPKIDFCDLNTTKCDLNTTKTVFLRMLKSLEDFEGKVFCNANLDIDNMNIYEIFINMYLQEVWRLVKRGLKSGYVGQEDNLNAFKGKLLFGEQIKHNLAHKERFYVAFDEFHPNRPENRLIKATLLKLGRKTKSPENAKEIRQLLVFFEFVDASVNYQNDFNSVIIDRNMTEYEKLMQWSRVFLFDKSFTTFSGSDNAAALLFKMDKLYERYVAKEVKKKMGDEWIVSVQDTEKYLFDDDPKKFSLRPDIVLTNRSTGEKVIMDTKWKRLSKNAHNYGISISDMYQMYAYSKKYGAENIWLLYPHNSEFQNGSISPYKSSDGTTVHVFFVDLVKMDDTMNTLKNSIK